MALTRGVLLHLCVHCACTVHSFGYCLLPRSRVPEFFPHRIGFFMVVLDAGQPFSCWSTVGCLFDSLCTGNWGPPFVGGTNFVRHFFFSDCLPTLLTPSPSHPLWYASKACKVKTLEPWDL